MCSTEQQSSASAAHSPTIHMLPVRAGFVAVSVLAKADRLTPVRAGFWRQGDAYVPAKLLTAVEPPVAGESAWSKAGQVLSSTDLAATSCTCHQSQWAQWAEHHTPHGQPRGCVVLL